MDRGASRAAHPGTETLAGTTAERRNLVNLSERVLSMIEREAKHPERSRRTMLVIDDEKIILDSCRRIFTAEGFEVETVEEPGEGLERVRKAKYDVIITDWRMPGFDGLDLVDLMDKHAPDSTIIMISGFPSVDRAADAIRKGAVDYIAKPFDPDGIVSAVERAMMHKAKMVAERRASSANSPAHQGFPMPELDDKPPRNIAETVAQKVGVGKVTSPWLSVFILGILGGAYVAFGGMLAATVTFDMSAYLGVGLSKFAAGAVFSLGLMLVIIAGAELFTGNNLMVSSVMTRNITVRMMLERWGLVYGANFIGAIILALIFVFSGLWKAGGGALAASAVGTAYAKVSLSFLEALVRGIGCNWLVCLGVWMAMSSRQTIGKIFAIFFPIMAFVAIGFEHSVANMYFVPTGIFLRDWFGIAVPAGVDAGILNWGTFVLRNLVPVTIGNIIGGGVFVGMSYWSAYLQPVAGNGEST